MNGLRWRWMHLRRTLREWPQWDGVLDRAAYYQMALRPMWGGGYTGELCEIRLKGYAHPLYYRDGASDARVLRQVFARREYQCVAHEPALRYLVDCGANVGYTTFFLLSRYPDARAVVVEPDSGNMTLCRKNLAPFADRVTFVQAGVWSASQPMVVVRGAYRDGAEWSFQVRPAGAGEAPDFQARTVDDLLAEGGFPHADVLKMDIEAAEAQVFQPGCGSWLPKVRTLVIELHGADCERIVHEATTPYLRPTETSGELTVFRSLPATR